LSARDRVAVRNAGPVVWQSERDGRLPEEGPRKRSTMGRFNEWGADLQRSEDARDSGGRSRAAEPRQDRLPPRPFEHGLKRDQPIEIPRRHTRPEVREPLANRLSPSPIEEDMLHPQVEDRLRHLGRLHVRRALATRDEAREMASLARDHRDRHAREATGICQRHPVVSGDVAVDSFLKPTDERVDARPPGHRLTRRMTIRPKEVA